MRKADDDDAAQPSVPGSGGLRLAPTVTPPSPSAGGGQQAMLTSLPSPSPSSTKETTTKRRKGSKKKQKPSSDPSSPSSASPKRTTRNKAATISHDALPSPPVLITTPNSPGRRRSGGRAGAGGGTEAFGDDPTAEQESITHTKKVTPSTNTTRQRNRTRRTRSRNSGGYVIPGGEDTFSLAPTVDTEDRPGAHYIGTVSGRQTSRSQQQQDEETVLPAEEGNATALNGGGEHLVTAYLVEEEEEDDSENGNKDKSSASRKPWRWIAVGFGVGLALLAIILGIVLGAGNDGGGTGDGTTTTTSEGNGGADSGTTNTSSPKPPSPTPIPTPASPTTAPTLGPIDWELVQTIPAPDVARLDSAFGRSLSISSRTREGQASTSTGTVIAIGGNGQVYVYFDVPEEDEGKDAIWFDSSQSPQPTDNAHLVVPLATFNSSPSPSFGTTVELSNDGFYMAVGEPSMERIHVLFFDGSGWRSHGDSPISTSQEIPWGNPGLALAFAKETKNVVAVGNGSNRVQVYELVLSPLQQDSENYWRTRGGSFMSFEVGKSNSIGLSDTGDILALGDPTADPNRQGRVQVFKWNAAWRTWGQLGEDIPGVSPDGRFGRAVALSGNGQVVAGGANFADVLGTNSNSGHVRVFEWQANSDVTSGSNTRQQGDDSEVAGEWVQRGQTLSINSEAQYEFGRLVELNHDGTVLMVSIPYLYDPSAGAVEIFYYEEGRWKQRGEQLLGDDDQPVGFIFGSALAMSADGDVIVTSITEGEHFLDGRRRQEKRALQGPPRVGGTVMVYQTRPA